MEGLNTAASKKTFLVSRVQPLSFPPIIPAIANGFLLSAITVVVSFNEYSLLSSANNFS